METEQDRRRKAEQRLDAIIDAMASGQGRIRTALRTYLADVARASEAFRSLGKNFSFSADERLREELERAKQRLIDRIEEILSSELDIVLAEEGEEDDDSAIFIPILSETREKTAEYVERMMPELEATAGSVLAEGGDAARIVSEYTAYMGVATPPPSVGRAMTAMAGAAFLSSPLVRHPGRGNYLSPLAALMRLVQTGTMRGYSLTALRRMSRSGMRWYRTFRRSNWDCPQCDAVAAVIHPITEQVLPVHPYCVCGMYEIDLM